jgi:cell fate regulator YaaT (PSP1 superfamily)
MQNNNETNENVSKVVAEFFKKKPLKQNHRNRPYHPNHHKKNAPDKPEAADDASTQATDKEVTVRGENTKRHDRSFRKNRHFNNKHEKHTAVELEAVNEASTETEAAASVEQIEITENDNIADAQAEAEVKENKVCENEWYDPEVLVEIIGVRFKAGGKVYYFAPNGVTAQKNDNIIVETARGLEFGTVQVPNSKVKISEVVMPLKNALRIATSDDVQKHEENQKKVIDAMRICNEKIAAHNLEMKLVDVEYTFDNTKLLFYFTSEGRVDFRELVKDLAGVFKTRIELRQIGIREETKLLGGIGICGLPFCCKSFLTDFVQVSIKMAKEQGLSLNSAKISGACGRLMCCLRYEYDTYDDEIRRTPKVDTPVITPDGPGVVCETQPLAGLCKVRFTENDETIIKVYHRDDLKRVDKNDDNE